MLRTTSKPAVYKSAILSGCGRFRYSLARAFVPAIRRLSYVNFLMLNPSVADADRDDATIRRCIGFARSWGFEGLLVTNLYPLISTDPSVLKKTPDRFGEMLTDGSERVNDMVLRTHALMSDLVVCAWGNHAEPHVAALTIADLTAARIPIHYLRYTKQGNPSHPLRLPASLRPMPVA